MAELLKAAPVTAAMNERTAARAAELAKRGVLPTLAIVRVGERPDDMAYERGACKRCEQVGARARLVELPEEVSAEKFFATLRTLNDDPAVHGILLFRPLPAHISDAEARAAIRPEKDVDGCTDASLAGVFTNTPTGFTPCTAQAALDVLHHYGIPVAGKRAVVVGRSLVVGRPAAMLLMHENATVTICHTRTENREDIIRQADIVVVCTGQAEGIGAEALCTGQVVVDVGINWSDEKGKLVGDVRFEEAEPVVAALTPVPGGVGSVTSSVLVAHVVEAAERQNRI